MEKDGKTYCDNKRCKKIIGKYQVDAYCTGCRSSFHKKCLDVHKVKDPNSGHYTTYSMCPLCGHIMK
jgi:hypothetical protein